MVDLAKLGSTVYGSQLDTLANESITRLDVERTTGENDVFELCEALYGFGIFRPDLEESREYHGGVCGGAFERFQGVFGSGHDGKIFSGVKDGRFEDGTTECAKERVDELHDEGEGVEGGDG